MGSSCGSVGRAVASDTNMVTYRSHLENFPCSYTYKHVRCPIFKFNSSWAVVVAQLAERLLLTPEACSSNPVIGNNLN